jgi:hypothetical protein
MSTKAAYKEQLGLFVSVIINIDENKIGGAYIAHEGNQKDSLGGRRRMINANTGTALNDVRLELMEISEGRSITVHSRRINWASFYIRTEQFLIS